MSDSQTFKDSLPGNVYALGLTNNGRPKLYATAEEFEVRVIEYFTQMKEDSIKATITGLVLFLGFSCLKQLAEYEQHSDFSTVAKRARLAVHNSYEHGGNAMDIFMLKTQGFNDRPGLPKDGDGKLKIGKDTIKKMTEEDKVELLRKIVS